MTEFLQWATKVFKTLGLQLPVLMSSIKRATQLGNSICMLPWSPENFTYVKPPPPPPCNSRDISSPGQSINQSINPLFKRATPRSTKCSLKWYIHFLGNSICMFPWSLENFTYVNPPPPVIVETPLVLVNQSINQSINPLFKRVTPRSTKCSLKRYIQFLKLLVSVSQYFSCTTN